MGSALSSHRWLLDCCPAGLLSLIGGGRWRSGASRGSCGSAAAFATPAHATAAGSAGDAAAADGGRDDFVPMKAQHNQYQHAEPGKLNESAGLIAAAGTAVESKQHQKQQQQQQHPLNARYGSTNPVAVTTEDEITPRESKPTAQQPHQVLDEEERRQLEQEMQLQQQQLQELQRMKLESQFPNRGLGQVHFVLQYLIAKSALYVRIIKGSSLTAQDSNGFSDPYVKIHLLPDTGKGTKLRTRTCQMTLNPAWDEEFCYSGVLPADLEKKNIRLTVLDEDTIGFDWMGEVVFPLRQLASGRKEFYAVFLQPKNEELERSLTSQATDRGKILIGLYYAPAKSELTVKVIQCVNLLAMDPNGYSDPFVKLFLKPGRNRSEKFKTEVKKKTLNPEFKEDFVFSISPQELPMKTLEITVWDKDFGTKNDFIGALMLGNKCSGDRWTHWEAVMKQPYQTHTKWHPLGAELHQHQH